MDFNYSEMQQMLVDSATKLVADSYTLEDLREQKHNPAGYNAKNWAQFAEMGWLALPLLLTASPLALAADSLAKACT